MPGIDGSRVVQTQDVPDAAQLQPTDLSGLNFFAAPAHAPEDDNLGKLADSLGHFSEDVRQFGRYYSVAQRSHDAGQKQEALGLIAAKTPSEWQQLVKDGKLPSFASPMAQAAVDRTTGQYAAHSLSIDVAQKVGTGELNWADGSAQKYLDDQRQSIIHTNGWSDTSGQMRGFGDAYNQVVQNAQGKAVQETVQNINEAHNQAAFQQIEMAVDGAFKSKMDPSQTWAALNNVRNGLVQTMHFQPKELDPMIFGALNRRSSTDPNWVMGVGNAPRMDVDGKTPIPSLFSKNTTADQVNSLVQRTRQFNADHDDATQKAAINGGIGQILNGPNPERLAGVPESIPYTNGVTGAQGQVSKAAALKAAVNARLYADSERIKSGQATNEEVMDEQLASFAKAGVRQDQWADALKNAAQGGANDNSLTDPKQQGSQVAAYQLYASLRAKNPAYLGALVDEKASRFFEDAYLQTTLFNKSPVEAMQAANLINSKPQSDHDQSDLASLKQQVATTAASLKYGGWTRPDIKNPEIARDIILHGAEGLMRINGIKAADAVKLAGDAASERFVPVNGQLVPDLHYLPKEAMQAASERYLSDWASGPAKALNLNPKTLSISPVGTGRYLIVDSTSGLPVEHGQGMSYVTGKDLIAAANHLLTDEQARAKAAQDRILGQTVSDQRRIRQYVIGPTPEPETPSTVGLGIMPDPEPTEQP